MDTLTVAAMIKEMRSACHNARPSIEFTSEDSVKLCWWIGSDCVHGEEVSDLELSTYKRFHNKIYNVAKRKMRGL